MMLDQLYPWGGKMTPGNPKSCVAVVTLSDWIDFPKDIVAIYGSMKTENLGVEKVVANIVSNPNIRYLIVAGKEVRGHRSGESIICLHKYGIDENNRVKKTKSAIPYIENLPKNAIAHFQKQVEIIDLKDIEDTEKIIKKIKECENQNPCSFGEPLYVEMIKPDKSNKSATSELNLHGDIQINPYGLIQ